MVDKSFLLTTWNGIKVLSFRDSEGTDTFIFDALRDLAQILEFSVLLRATWIRFYHFILFF